MAARKSPAEGRKSDKLMRDAIMVALKREAEGGKTKKLYQVAEALVDKAVGGDVQAIKEICDRVDGKAVQPVANDGDEAFRVELVKRVIVRTED